MRTLGIIIVLILWALFCWKACTDFSDPACCGDEPAAAVVPLEKSIEKCALSFGWKSSEPVLGDDWTSYRDNLLSSLDEDDELQLTLYYGEEESQATCDARATSTISLFTDLLASERIKVTCTERLYTDDDKRSGCNRVNFRKLAVSETIKETADGTLIYFPFNSTNKLNDATVEAYLDDVAERVKASGESVRLTGHTDDIGSNQSNIALGQRRADIVKNYLRSKGVAANKINASSQGEASPVVPNNSNANRAKNRRTELQIIN